MKKNRIRDFENKPSNGKRPIFTNEQLAKLVEVYNESTYQELKEHFPDHSYKQINGKAHRLGLSKNAGTIERLRSTQVKGGRKKAASAYTKHEMYERHEGVKAAAAGLPIPFPRKPIMFKNPGDKAPEKYTQHERNQRYTGRQAEKKGLPIPFPKLPAGYNITKEGRKLTGFVNGSKKQDKKGAEIVKPKPAKAKPIRTPSDWAGTTKKRDAERKQKKKPHEKVYQTRVIDHSLLTKIRIDHKTEISVHLKPGETIEQRKALFIAKQQQKLKSESVKF